MSYCFRWPPGARAQRGSPVLYHPSPQLCPAPARLSTHCSRSAVHPLEPQAAAAPPLRQLNTLRCFHTDHRLATRHPHTKNFFYFSLFHQHKVFLSS